MSRVLLAHDFAEAYGGAERIFAEAAVLYPDAPFYALLGRRAVAERMGVGDRFHSLLPSRARVLRHYRWMAPAYPAIVAGLRLPPADLLITSSYAHIHGIRTENDAPQLCYCYGPLRYAWSQEEAYAGELPGGRLTERAFSVYAAAMRGADRRASRQVTRYLTESPYTVELIERCYGVEAHVVAPPIDTDTFRPDPTGPDDYFLFCGRLVEAYKRPSVVVEAFNRLPHLKLRIAGDGPARPDLERLARGDNIEFLGHLDDAELVRAMARCRAAIFPSVDDFGLIPVEVAACGRPVLAYARGGALHTVVEGATGAFFHEQTPEAVVDAVRAFDDADYDTRTIRAHAEGWSVEQFRAGIRRHADDLLAAS